MKEVEGIIFSIQDYGETSKILNVITKEYGIIGLIAKGSRTLKSSLRSVTDKLTYGVFHIYYKEGKLSILNSVDVLNPFKSIKKDIEKITYASYLLELSSQVMKQNFHTDIYPLLISGLLKMEEGYDSQVIMNILELKYLDYLGVMPVLDGCAKCGNKTNIVTISVTYGGYLCNRCNVQEKIVSEKTLKLIRMFYYVDVSKISKLFVSKEVKQEINFFLNQYYDKYTGLYLKSKNFIKNLEQIKTI